MPRFIPLSSLPSAAPSAPDSGGMSAEGVLGLARGGANLAGSAGRFLQVPGASYLSALGGPLQIGQGIASGNPVSTFSGAVNTAGTVGNLLGPAAGGAGAGGLLAGGLAGGAGGAGAALGSAGAYGALTPGILASGLPGASIGGGAVGGAVGAGGLAGGSGGAAGLGLGAGLSGLSTVMAPIAAIAAIAFMNSLHQDEKARINQTQESLRMRQGAQQGIGMLRQGQQAAQAGSPDLEAFRNPLAGQHVVQQAIGARGQGGAMSLTHPLDQATLDAWTQAYYPALRDTQVGYVNALDAAARGGQALPAWTQGFGTYDPAALLHNQSMGVMGNQPSSVNAYWGTDYSQAVPGTLGRFLPAHLGPGQMADRYAALPALPGGHDLTPEQIQQAAQQRQQAAQTQYQTAMQASGGTPRGLLNPEVSGGNLAYAAPYLPGGTEQLWRDLGLPQDLIDMGRAGMTDLPSALATLQGRIDAAAEMRRASGGGG